MRPRKPLNSPATENSAATVRKPELLMRLLGSLLLFASWLSTIGPNAQPITEQPPLLPLYLLLASLACLLGSAALAWWEER